jgi:hypothetical protein
VKAGHFSADVRDPKDHDDLDFLVAARERGSQNPSSGST